MNDAVIIYLRSSRVYKQDGVTKLRFCSTTKHDFVWVFAACVLATNS